jgi:hypothetical protein
MPRFCSRSRFALHGPITSANGCSPLATLHAPHLIDLEVTQVLPRASAAGSISDPKDDLVLEVAVAGNCKAIVTHNRRHFEGAGNFGIRISAPLNSSAAWECYRGYP